MLGPQYFWSSSNRADEERAIREANAVLRSEWSPAETAADAVVIASFVLFAILLAAAQAC